VAAPRRGRDDRPCKSWLERRRDEEAGLGYGVQPHRLIVSGGQGRIGLGARLERLAFRRSLSHSRSRPASSRLSLAEVILA
jgi:putative flavoprotein involved in K+ transport